jgi:hypothetical protein
VVDTAAAGTVEALGGWGTENNCSTAGSSEECGREERSHLKDEVPKGVHIALAVERH